MGVRHDSSVPKVAAPSAQQVSRVLGPAAQPDGDGVGCLQGLGHPGLLDPRPALAQASTFDGSGIDAQNLRPEQDVAKAVAVLGNLAGALPGRLAGGGRAGRLR